MRSPISRVLPDWALDARPDYQHFHRRRYTPRYRAKKRVVRDLWIGAGCVMLLHPVLAFVLTTALITTFVAFVILDETP